jgi:histidinol-phosphate aminotransferase
MLDTLSRAAESNLLERGFSRRQLGRIAAVLTAGATLPFYNEAALAQRALRAEIPSDAVRINSNENPLGPCPEAIDAITQIARFGGRYSPHGEDAQTVRTVAQSIDLKPDYIAFSAGSGDPLMRTALAFTSPSRPWVMGNPGYESGASAATFIGAKVIRVPLRKDNSHDVQAMVKADPNPGVIYLTNPNNPTGTLTSLEDIEWTAANMPKGTLLLVDEAYIHFSQNAKSAFGLVSADKDVMVLRTFSKVYGMAGIRAGYAAGRPDLLAKLRPWGQGNVPITSLAASMASLKSKTVVPERFKINRDIREDVFAYLDKKNLSYTKSEANHFMVNVGRPGGEVVQALAKEKVLIGRLWPAWPNHVRVSIGTADDMAKFKAAFSKVMA